MCAFSYIFYRLTLRRRADDIFTTQRPITLSVCSAQSGDKKCNVYNTVWNYDFTESAKSRDKNAMCITQFEIMTLLKVLSPEIKNPMCITQFEIMT